MKKILILLLCVLANSCSKDGDPVALSTKNLIVAFSLNFNGEIIDGQIDQQKRIIKFDTELKNVSSLKPSIRISEKARIEPSPEIARDFRETVSYTVYAENGTPNVYRVQVNNRPISLENEINSFSFVVEGKVIDAKIDRTTGIIRVDLPHNDLSGLRPNISIPNYASIDPPANEAQDFTAPVTYVVTAENGDTKTYKVQVNEPAIDGISGGYFANPKFYVGAEAVIQGRYLKNEGEVSNFFLFDGTNKYELEQVKFHFSYSGSGTDMNYNAISFVIPDNIPTNVYKVVVEKRGYRTEFMGLDVKAENVPEPLSTSQEIFSFNDSFTVYGNNLTARIVVPSNGSHYLLWETYAVDIKVNEARTEMVFTPNYRQQQLYPSYYGREPEEKKITFFDEAGRIGKSIRTIFK